MKTGILLCGCGIGDGSCVEEVMLTYLALDKHQMEYVPLAISENQHEVANHYTTKKTSETRNTLIESARIGRGVIEDLCHFDTDQLDGLIIPGGMGIFKNISSYMADKDSFSVHPEVERLIKKMYDQQKPIGGICASTILIAKSISESFSSNLKVCTFNNAYKDLLTSLKTKVINCPANDVVVDADNKIVTTPAFMASKNMYEIALGIDKLVKIMVQLSK